MDRAMAIAPRLAMERAYLTRPTGAVISSILLSTANKASKMLVAAASAAAMGTGEGLRWRPMDHVRYLVMLTSWFNVWLLRVVMDLFPRPPKAIDSSAEAFLHRFIGTEGSSSSVAIVPYGGGEDGLSWSPSSTSTCIGRALSHILGILNEIPATSRKYEFVLATAERIVNENVQHGGAALASVSRAALAAAFSRTCELLRRSLERSEAEATATWPSRVLRLLPVGGPHLADLYDALRAGLGTFLAESSADTWRSRTQPASRQLSPLSPAARAPGWLEAEKLANELLWIANKLRSCSGAGEAIVRWGFATSLASLSLTAHPRVQGPIIKISAVLFKELANGEWEAPREVRFRILAVWLPLLCYASNGVTGPVLMGCERYEMERVVEDLIAGLPLEDQEVILGNWLEDFAATDSDWPNLQSCFHRWCRDSRKLLF